MSYDDCPDVKSLEDEVEQSIREQHARTNELTLQIINLKADQEALQHRNSSRLQVRQTVARLDQEIIYVRQQILPKQVSGIRAVRCSLRRIRAQVFFATLNVKIRSIMRRLQG